MVVKEMSRELYDSLGPLRMRPVGKLVEAPVTVRSNSSIAEVIGILTGKDAYDAFIPLSNNKVASINMHDILQYRHISSAKPSTIGKIVPTLSYEQKIGYAARIMGRYRLRALPVVERNKIVGQVSARSIVNVINDSGIGGIRTSNIMTPNPIVVAAEDKASTAKGIMVRRKIDHLPVMQDSKLVGIVTSAHIVRAKLPSEKVGRRSFGMEKIIRMNFPVIGVAERNVITSGPDDTLRSVTGLMIDKNSPYTIVKLADEVQGIITYRDVVGVLEERVEEDIPAFIVGLPDDPFDAELAKSKFVSTVKLLRKASPEIEEARCNMKIRDKRGERRRYEVDIHVITPYERITYTNTGWDLAKMFDQVSNAMKKKLAHRLSKKRRSSRYRTDFYTP